MSKKDEALKLALAALEGFKNPDLSSQDSFEQCELAITAIREALAEQPAQQQEPVAWHGYDLDGMVEAFDRVIQAHYNSKQPFHSPVDSDAQMALRILRGFIPSMKRYTSPPASKPWVGLTEDEITKLWDEIIKYAPGDVRLKDFAYAIEAKLREKNA